MLWGEYNYDEDIAAQRQEAFDDGVAKGISRGIEQGSHQKAIDTARNFLSMGLSIEQIAQGTGLAKSEVEQLAKEIEANKT